MKIYKIKVNGKSYRVELEAIEQVSTVPIEEKKKKNRRKLSAMKAVNKLSLRFKVRSQILKSKLVIR